MANTHRVPSIDDPKQIRRSNAAADGSAAPDIGLLRHQIYNDEKEILSERAKLPAAQQEPNSKAINWLGGSYSGTDLKVVAHLYDQAKGDVLQARLESDLAFNDTLAQSAGILKFNLAIIAINTNTWQERAQLVLNYTGLGAEGSGPKVLGLLLNVLRGIDFSSTQGIAKGIIAFDNIRINAEKTRDALSEQLDRHRKVKDQSQNTVVLGTLQTISVQSHREKYAVRALGHAYPKAYTRGPRTIAGSMIFTLFDENAFTSLINAMSRSTRFSADEELSTLLPDQLPPIDITLAFANEYGSLSQLSIYGVEFLNDGATYSIEDLLSENVVNFVARDVDKLTKTGQVHTSRSGRGLSADSPLANSASNLIFGKASYEDYLKRLRVRRRLVNR